VTPGLKVGFINHTAPGWEMEDVVGKDGLDFITPEYHDAAREAVERVIRSGASESFETRATGPDGEDAWYWCRLGPVKVAGEVVSVACVSTDVTQRKQAEESLRESEERYRTVCEKSKDGISLVVDGKIEYVNPRLCEMLGFSEQELKEGPPLEFVAPEERKRAAERLQALLRGGGEQTSRFRFPRKDGTVVVLEGSGRALRLHAKPAFLHVVRDVTEHAEPDVAKDEMAALTAARAALEEVAPLLPRDSLADLASARALSKIYKLLIRRER
jgi:PAS domain S-box-containing protein